MNIRIPRSGKAATLARKFLQTEGVTISHSQALELVAKLHGYSSNQAMQSDKAFEDAPALKPRSSNEYDFVGDRGEAVWLSVENLSVHVKREHEGVVVDVFAKGAEDQESLAGTWVTYAEGEPDDEEADASDEPVRWFLRHDEAKGEWFITRKDYGATGPCPEPDAPAFEWGADALDHLVEEEGSGKVAWEGNMAAARKATRFEVLQRGGLCDYFPDFKQARDFAKAMAESGAEGPWAVQTTEGVEVALYLYAK